MEISYFCPSDGLYRPRGGSTESYTRGWKVFSQVVLFAIKSGCERRREARPKCGPGRTERAVGSDRYRGPKTNCLVWAFAVARIYDEAVADLRRRKDAGLIERVFDSTAQLLGRAHHAIEAELIYTLGICAAGAVDVRTLTVKACAVDRAVEIGEQLERIMGRAGSAGNRRWRRRWRGCGRSASRMALATVCWRRPEARCSSPGKGDAGTGSGFKQPGTVPDGERIK